MRLNAESLVIRLLPRNYKDFLLHNGGGFGTIVSMNTVAIYIKTQPEIKAKAQKIAENLGLSLSSLMSAWLRQFVKTKRVSFKAREEIPSKYLIESLKKSEEDLKAGRVLSFDSGEEAVKYFKSLEENE